MYLTCAITRGPIARNANVQHLPHKPVGRWPLDLRSASHVPVPKKRRVTRRAEMRCFRGRRNRTGGAPLCIRCLETVLEAP
jgi:hypothetical protein